MAHRGFPLSVSFSALLSKRSARCRARLVLSSSVISAPLSDFIQVIELKLSGGSQPLEGFVVSNKLLSPAPNHDGLPTVTRKPAGIAGQEIPFHVGPILTQKTSIA